MIDVLIVDDHWMVRRGLAEALAEIDLVGSVTSVDNVRDAFAAVRAPRKRPLLVVLDAMLGLDSGLSSIEGLRSIDETVRVLVLTILSEDPHGVRAIEAGADGFLIKGSSLADFTAAVREIAGGGQYVSASLGQLLAKRLSGRDELTPREWEVARHYVMGFGCVQTARMLSLSPKTVSTHKANVLRKLGLTSTADLVRWGVERNIGEVGETTKPPAAARA